MSDKKQKQRQADGFTLIELLVVISIIVMIIGILVPGIQAFKRTADNLRQKSRFHAMEVGLELYQKDFKEYPESQVLDDGSNGAICGANRLAEALLGRDLRGFDLMSSWYAPLDEIRNATPPGDIYAIGTWATPAQEEASKMRRKGPYMNLKDVTALNLGDGAAGQEWYDAPSISAANLYPGTVDYPSPVISDIFYKKVIKVPNWATGQDVSYRVGTPVLYFKANRSEKISRGYDPDNDGVIDDYRHLIYNWEDNEPMFDLPVYDSTKIHHYNSAYSEPGPPVMNGDDIFYDDITNPKVSAYLRPVNARTFLLISAGRDGIYGTKDDVTNFSK